MFSIHVSIKHEDSPFITVFSHHSLTGIFSVQRRKLLPDAVHSTVLQFHKIVVSSYVYVLRHGA